MCRLLKLMEWFVLLSLRRLCRFHRRTSYIDSERFPVLNSNANDESAERITRIVLVLKLSRAVACVKSWLPQIEIVVRSCCKWELLMLW